GICKNRFHSLDLPFFISYFHRQRHSSPLNCEPAFYRCRKEFRIQKDSFIFFIDFFACSKIHISFLSPASLYRTVLFSLEIPPDIWSTGVFRKTARFTASAPYRWRIRSTVSSALRLFS